MPTKEKDAKFENSNNGDGLPPDHTFEAWQHYANAGGVDKNTMVTVASWLLGGSAAILTFIATKLFDKDSFILTHPVPMLFLAGAGLLVSGSAGFIALIYGGYANWNWARAHDIARAREWTYLYPDRPNSLPNGELKGLIAAAAGLASPNCAQNHLAPIFIVFLVSAILSFVTHLTILIWSVVSIQ